MRAAGLFTLLCSCIAASTALAAQNCPPLKMIASVNTETDAAGSMLMPGNFSGTRKLLLVDTGGFFHELRPGVIRELALPTRQNQTVVAVDVLGGQTSVVARAPAFSIGPMIPTSVDFMQVVNEGLLGNNPAIAGLFVPAVFYRNHDVDLDFAGRKFNLFAQDHCKGGVVYWPNNGVAIVPFKYDASNHIIFTVKVDGHALRAQLDSGASHTTMYTRVARRIGVDPDSGGAADVGDVGGNPNVRLHQYRFRKLAIEGITVNNPTVMLIPDLSARTPEGPSTSGGRNDTRFSKPRSQPAYDMLIGMSVLRHLHVYIATNEKTLYITSGSTPDVPAEPAAIAPRSLQPPAQQPPMGNGTKPFQ